MSQAQAESFLKNIIREILTKCEEERENVSETLVAFMVKAVVLDPDNDFNVDQPLDKSHVQKLIETCVHRVLEKDSSRLDTIKLQVYFDLNYTPRQDFLAEHHRLQKNRLQNLYREIMDTRARTGLEIESLYRKIVMYILLSSGLGSPTDVTAIRETTAALSSVFMQSELGTFMNGSKESKDKHVQELCQIVPGIRLFNRDAKKGGEGIEDLPNTFHQLYTTTQVAVTSSLTNSQEIANKLTACMELLITDNGQHYNGKDYHLLRDALINTRQNEAFLKVILSDLEKSYDNVELANGSFEQLMVQLRDAVKAKSAVPTELVYPLFMMLSEEWFKFQDEVVLLSVLANVHSNMKGFIKVPVNLLSAPDIQILLSSATIQSDNDRQLESLPTVDTSVYPNVDFIFPDNIKNFTHLSLEFSGFCAYCLSVYDRALIPGRPCVGLMKYKNKVYCFSCKEYAIEFSIDPNQHIDRIIRNSKRSAELIQLLNLQNYYSNLRTSIHPDKLIVPPITKSDQGCQTDTHILQPVMYRDYEWNEWELRRKAIRITNLRSKLTHSTQTDLSHFRSENETQVYLPKENWTQSKRDQMTSVPKPSTYIAGLRGTIRDENKSAVVVDLTLPIETHFS